MNIMYNKSIAFISFINLLDFILPWDYNFKNPSSTFIAFTL